MGCPDWDRELAKAEIKRLAPRVRQRRALLSLERKVALIEAEANRPDDGGARPGLPVDRAKLRRWTDSARGLWAWSTPAFDHPRGHNASLIARFEAAIDRIRLRHGRGRGALRREIAADAVRIARLEAQVMHLMEENRGLRASVAGASGPGSA